VRIRRRRTAILAESGLVSMGDIAFQLIIFFMVAASFVQSTALNVELPNASDEVQEERSDTITLQASETALALDERPVDLPEVSALLRALLQERPEPDRVVVLLTSDDVTFQRQAVLMHAIRAAGGTVALMYEEEGP